jgi:hypothetical protein
MGTLTRFERYGREIDFGGKMFGSTIGISWRGIAYCLTCVAIGGAALAQDLPPTSAPPSTTTATPVPSAAEAPPAAPAATPPAQLLTQGQLDQLVAPIALYPDPLLAQILMASTYPLEVVEAARWISAPANKALQGDALTNALQAQSWDPSVKALVPFPRVLDNMSDQLQWTERLGNAFLAQQADVMTAVQSLRHQAMAAGNLKQTPQCRCMIQTSGETISILPAQPQGVCVPVYSPVAYGAWPYPAYPPVSFPEPVGFAYPPGFWIGFEPPILLASFGPIWGWGWIDWGHHGITVDPGRYVLASGGHASFSGSVWVHDAAHRGGVAYADPATRARFDAARVSTLTASGRIGNEASRGGVGRFGAAATHGGPAASHREAAFHGMAAVHGGTAPRGEASFHGVPAAHGGTGFHSGPAFHGGGPHGGGAPHFAIAAPHGGGAARGPMGGSPHGGGAPHVAIGAPHGGGGAPHGGGPHGSGPGGHHG